MKRARPADAPFLFAMLKTHTSPFQLVSDGAR
jgi:hypothetical protein